MKIQVNLLYTLLVAIVGGCLDAKDPLVKGGCTVYIVLQNAIGVVAARAIRQPGRRAGLTRAVP